jgi:hypothetical protein
MIIYLGVVMFAIFHETHTPEKVLSDSDFWIRHAEVWIRIELIVFFFQILCSCIFLAVMQCKGEFGKNLDPNF